MIQIAICDDNEYALNTLKKFISNGFAKHTDDYRIKCFTNGNLLLNDNEHIPFNVLFLDIDMPRISGFDIAKKLRSNFSRCFIIFVTSHSNLVYKSFDFQPFHFIQKNPQENLEKSIAYVIESLMCNMKQNKKIILENPEETAAVYYHNIIFIESNKHYLKYHIQNKENPVSIRGSITETEMEFKKYDFIRIHRRFIVNLKYIKFVDKKIGKVYINYNGVKKALAMGTSYKDIVDEKYTLYLREMS